MGSIRNKEIENFKDLSLPMLIDFISNAHHSYLRGVIKSFDVHFKTVRNVDCNTYPAGVAISEKIIELKVLLEQHLYMEEEILFPFIKTLNRAHKSPNKVENTSILILKIKREHTSISELLSKLRTLSNDYTAASNAAPALKLYYAQMFELEQDILRHVFIEENFLFPKLKEYEKRMRSAKQIVRG